MRSQKHRCKFEISPSYIARSWTGEGGSAAARQEEKRHLCCGREMWPCKVTNLLRNQAGCRRQFKLDFREVFKGIKASLSLTVGTVTFFYLLVCLFVFETESHCVAHTALLLLSKCLFRALF